MELSNALRNDLSNALCNDLSNALRNALRNDLSNALRNHAPQQPGAGPLPDSWTTRSPRDPAQGRQVTA